MCRCCVFRDTMTEKFPMQLSIAGQSVESHQKLIRISAVHVAYAGGVDNSPGVSIGHYFLKLPGPFIARRARTI